MWVVFLKNYFFPISEKLCPGGANPCSNHGQCDTSTGICSCEVGRHGKDCSSESVIYVSYIKINIFLMISLLLEFNCPGDDTCSNQGTCNSSSGTCICNAGFEGNSCQGMYGLHKYVNLFRTLMITLKF